MTADDLGPKISAARRRLRWSQRRLAIEVGVSQRTIGAWERGEVQPRYAEGDIDALEQALGVSLTGGQPEEDPNEKQFRELELPPSVSREDLLAAYHLIQRRRTA